MDKPTTPDNTKEVYALNLTEWERDTLLQTISACTYKGTHVEIVAKFKEKIASLKKEDD